MIIKDYIKSTDGWNELSIIPGVVSLIRPDGINVQVSLREAKSSSKDKVIHVSIAPLRSCREDLTDEEHASLILKQTPLVLKQLFDEEYAFKRMPADPRKPDLNHYYSEVIL